MRVGRWLRRGLISTSLALVLVWSVALVATALQVGSVRAELGDIAQEVAHHCAHSGGDEALGRRYLRHRLSVLRRPLHIRSSQLRTLLRGDAAVIEVTVTAVVGFAIGGHPRVRISVTRSAPVEALGDLP